MPAQGRWLFFPPLTKHFPTFSAIHSFTQSWNMKLFFATLSFCFLVVYSFSQNTPRNDSAKTKSAGDSLNHNQQFFLEPVEITAIRAGDKSPFAKVTLGAGQIA